MRYAAGVLLAVLIVLASLSAPAAGADEVVTLTVTVVDQNGDPIGADATLTATWDGGSDTAETSASGQVLLDVQKGADITVEVDHPDYVRNRPLTVEDASQRDVEVPVWQQGQLTVTVTNQSSTIEGAQVSFSKDQLTQYGNTNASGVFETGAIEQGSYVVRVSRPTYLDERRTVEVDGNVSETVSLEPGSVRVEFRVVDEQFEPDRTLENARVTVTRDGSEVGTVTTAADGTQSVRVPVNSLLQLTVSREGYVESQQTVRVAQRTEQYNISIRRTPAIAVEADATRVVAGEATDIQARNEYGEPIVGATVLLDGESVGETDEEGEYRLGIDDPGEHEVTVSDGDLSSEPLSITAISGTTREATQTETETPTPTPTDTLTPTATATVTATATGTETTTTTTQSGGTPGFTAVAALLALATAAVLARARE